MFHLLFSFGRHGNPLLECMECGEEFSIQLHFDNRCDEKKIDDFVAKWCKMRVAIPRDGHCICSSWIRVRLFEYKQQKHKKGLKHETAPCICFPYRP